MVLSTFGYLLKNVHLRCYPHFSSLQHTTGRERFKTVPYIEFRLPAGSPPALDHAFLLLIYFKKVKVNIRLSIFQKNQPS
jgi:hypothetical protein